MARIAHIQQRNGCDCGVAVVAMLAHIPYEGVKLTFSRYPDGITPMRLKRMLEKYGKRPYLYYIYRPRSRVRLLEMPTPAYPSAWMIRHPKWGGMHWIAVVRRKIYDPALEGSCHRDEYERNDWNVVSIVEPE